MCSKAYFPAQYSNTVYKRSFQNALYDKFTPMLINEQFSNKILMEIPASYFTELHSLRERTLCATSLCGIRLQEIAHRIEQILSELSLAEQRRQLLAQLRDKCSEISYNLYLTQVNKASALNVLQYVSVQIRMAIDNLLFLLTATV